MPEAKNFVKFDPSAEETLNIIPAMNEVLRYIIPPQVRKMQGEFKSQIQNLIDQQFKNLEKQDLEQKAFLGQYQLPGAYHELTSTSDVPDDYWQKIEEFQKKGALSNFA